MKRVFSGTTLLLLALSLLVQELNVTPVAAIGYIYIRANGSVDPPTPQISTADNITYTLVGDITNFMIIVQRSGIIFNGNGHKLRGPGTEPGSEGGILCLVLNNLTITNMNIENFYFGIAVGSSSFVTISGNNVTGNGGDGIAISYCSNATVFGNYLDKNQFGIILQDTNCSKVFENTITNNRQDGIDLDHNSNHNCVSENCVRNNSYCGISLSLFSSYNNIHDNFVAGPSNNGISCQYSANNNIVSGNTIANCSFGGYFEASSGYTCSNNTLVGNNLVGNNQAIQLDGAIQCTVTRNNVTRNMYGLWSQDSSLNSIYHNNFVNSTYKAYGHNANNTLDNGYPSGGNYWSDYSGVDVHSGPFQNETGSDGIGDTAYTVYGTSLDHYPLIRPWTQEFTVLNHLVIGHQRDIGSLDPARIYDPASFDFLENVYETLISLDKEKTDQFVPRLAKSWSISGDGLTYVFEMRTGVEFHNGETLTTEDVEYSLERILVVEGDPAWMLYDALFGLFESIGPGGNVTAQQMDNAITRTNTTVTLHLARPYPPLMQTLSMPWVSIVSKKWCVSIGEWPQTWNNWTSYNRPAETAIELQSADPPGPRTNAACGTGPYKLDYYQKGVELQLFRFDEYWAGWPAKGAGGSLRRITSKKIGDWRVAERMLLEGELDSVNLPQEAVNEVQGQHGVICYSPEQELACYALLFTFNISVSSPYMGVPGGLPPNNLSSMGIPPNFFTDVHVRRGFAYAFNYSKLIREALYGEATQPATPIVPGIPFHNAGQDRYSVNMSLATAQFMQAWGGKLWVCGFNFTLCYYSGSPIQQKACEIVKANVESLNPSFHIQLEQTPFASNYTYMAMNSWLPIFESGWLADFADPHDMVLGFMYSGANVSRSLTLTQWQKYSNATLDGLVRAGIGTTNETLRRDIYYELQRSYHEDCPSLPLYQSTYRRFERDWVHGWLYNPLLAGGGSNCFYLQWKQNAPSPTRYDWPMFHHDLKHSGDTKSPAPNTNQKLWNYTTGDAAVSSPSVVDGRVYAGSFDDHRVYCLNALSGAPIWNYTTGGQVSSSPAVADGRVYVGSRDRKIYCLDAFTGAHIWNFTTDYSVSSSPAVADGRVYVGSLDRNVYCLDAFTGAPIWNYTTGDIVYSSPAVANGRVYVGSFDSRVYCLDALSGAPIWNYTTDDWIGSSPSVVDGRVYVGSFDERVYCLDALSGAPIWNYKTGHDVYSSPAVANGRVYVGSFDSRVYCLDALSGAPIWNYTTGGPVSSSPAVADGRVYVGSLDRNVYCLDASTGARIWNYTTGDQVESSPAIADGTVIIGSNDHNVYAFGNVTRVPQDYKTVQEAIDAAFPGSTIWIAPGTYHESLIINKTITIIGKPGSAPVFDGGGSGVFATLLKGASGTVIAGIVITNWKQGVVIADASNCKIYDNIVSLIQDNGVELTGASAADNTIYANSFQNTNLAINVTGSADGNVISKNIISFNSIGLTLRSSGNTIYANIISDSSETGIEILASSQNNIIHHNSFLNNKIDAEISATTNTWDDGWPSGGNYWSTFTGPDNCRGPDQKEPGSDGIIDNHYTVATNNIDEYPLAQPYEPHDIGAVSLSTSKTVVAQGQGFYISFKVINHGIHTESFRAVAYVDTTVMAETTVTLIGRDAATVTMFFGIPNKGTYILSVSVGPVADETDTSDNRLANGLVQVTLLGDVNGDKKVDLKDVFAVGKAFGSTRDPDGLYRHNPLRSCCPHSPNCDLIEYEQGKIDLKDYYTACKNYGKSW